MNIVNKNVFEVIGDTQACVMPYKASNRQSKYLFGVLYLFNWIFMGMNQSIHRLFQVIGDTQACVVIYKESNGQSKYLFGAFLYN